MSTTPRRRKPTWRSLRVRVPVIAMLVFTISLAIAAVLAHELLLEDGRRDIDVVIDREQQRFERSMTELLAEEVASDPDLDPVESLRNAVFRFLELNPSTQSYWTIVTFNDGERLAASNGPPELEPLFADRSLPSGELNVRETISTDSPAGDIRTSSVPIMLGEDQVATLQIVSPMAPVRAEAMEAAGLVAAAAGIALLLGGILLTVFLWRSLSPLGALAQAARSTELRALDARVPEPETQDEVGLLAREFNTMLARLDEASAKQREFMASVGHELRTPITIARGHLEMLQRVNQDDPQAFDETVLIVRDELGRMGRLVEDLMAIARRDMEDFARPRNIDLVSWFEELELKLAGTPTGTNVRIMPPPPVTIEVDPDRLAQAVLNLVANAHTHTPEGTPVRVSAQLGDQQIGLIVEDQGPGIPESIRDDVFSPFVRAGEAPSSTGLGLAVVRAVVDAHAGNIDVHTGLTGTAIRLRLPWEPTDSDLELLDDVDEHHELDAPDHVDWHDVENADHPRSARSEDDAPGTSENGDEPAPTSV